MKYENRYKVQVLGLNARVLQNKANAYRAKQLTEGVEFPFVGIREQTGGKGKSMITVTLPNQLVIRADWVILKKAI